jgi:hypothetical protein
VKNYAAGRLKAGAPKAFGAPVSDRPRRVASTTVRKVFIVS